MKENILIEERDMKDKITVDYILKINNLERELREHKILMITDITLPMNEVILSCYDNDIFYMLSTLLSKIKLTSNISIKHMNLFDIVLDVKKPIDDKGIGEHSEMIFDNNDPYDNTYITIINGSDSIIRTDSSIDYTVFQNADASLIKDISCILSARILNDSDIQRLSVIAEILTILMSTNLSNKESIEVYNERLLKLFSIKQNKN